MKKHFTSFLLLMAMGMMTKAQVAMENHVPSVGTTYGLASVTNTITDGAVGADVVWDYSSLTSSPISSYTVVNLSTLPNEIKDSVPDATFGTRLEVGAPADKAPYDFYKDLTSCYVKIGTKSSGSNPVERKWDTTIVFGQTYNTTIWYGGLNRMYAGYGTLKLNGKTLNDVVMLRSWITGSTDTLVQFHRFNPSYQLLFSYLKKTSGIVNGLLFEPTSSSAVKETVMPVAELYPNPATNEFHIRLSKKAEQVKVTILDISGKSIFAQTAHSVNEMDLSSQLLTSGLYLVMIEADGAWSQQKLSIR